MLPDLESKLRKLDLHIYSCLVASATSQQCIIEERAFSNVFLPFLRKINTRMTLIWKVINFSQRLAFVNFKFSN